MKNLKKALGITILCIIFGLFTITAFSQGPGAPPPPGHGETENVPGGGAPIGGGLVILLALGAGYGAKKYYDIKKKKLLE